MNLKPCQIKRQFFRDLFLDEGLSAAQIAERVGLSKTAVLERLRRRGIRNLLGRKTNPNHYRIHEPPYGFRKQEGRLAPCKPELKVCRTVVQMYEEKKWTYSAIGRVLELKGYRNRRGEKRRNHGTVGIEWDFSFLIISIT